MGESDRRLSWHIWRDHAGKRRRYLSTYRWSDGLRKLCAGIGTRHIIVVYRPKGFA